jgi:hypothetical protein
MSEAHLGGLENPWHYANKFCKSSRFEWAHATNSNAKLELR